MKTSQRLFLLSIVIFLSACNRPTPPAANLPPETVPGPTTKAASTDQGPTRTPFPTFTPAPATASPELPTPVPPTEDPKQERAQNSFPLLQPGQEFNILKIKMVDADTGWSIATGDPGSQHILRTGDGGNTWRDVSPPQPTSPDRRPQQAAAAFFGPESAWVIYTGSELIWSTADAGATWESVQLDFQTLGGALFTVLDRDHVWLFQFLDAGMQKVYTAEYRTADGGQSWVKLLDPYQDASIQAFDKTGAVFHNPQYGWLTRDFRGVQPMIQLDVTEDGGSTWQAIPLPEPTSAEDLFRNCACGLYDPQLTSSEEGTFRVSCSCFQSDAQIINSYYYQTTDGGENWNIQEMPEGKLYHVSSQVLYAVGNEIFRSEDGGNSWTEVKTVFWEGQFSFVNRDLAWAVAYDPEDEEYAMVKTTDGCRSFIEIDPQIR